MKRVLVFFVSVYEMAAKINCHTYGTKLGYCHPVHGSWVCGSGEACC